MAADISTLFSFTFVRCAHSCGHFNALFLYFCPLRSRLRTNQPSIPWLLSAVLTAADKSTLFSFTFVRCAHSCGQIYALFIYFCPLITQLRTNLRSFHLLLSADHTTADISTFFSFTFVRRPHSYGQIPLLFHHFCPQTVRTPPSNSRQRRNYRHILIIFQFNFIKVVKKFQSILDNNL